MASKRKSFDPPPLNGAKVEATCRVDIREFDKLSPVQTKAFMSGVALVIAALNRAESK